MSVESVTAKYASRRASATLGPVAEYQVTYIVICTSTDDDESTIYNATASGIPAQYDTYAGDDDAHCTGLDLEHVENTAGGKAIWHATATYKTRDDRSTPGTNISYPLSRPATYTWTHQKYDKVRAYDIEGNAFKNSAGDPLESPPVFEITYPILIVEKNESSFDYGKAYYYSNKINSNTFYTAPPGYCKCEGISGQGPYYESSQTFWRVSYEFHFNPYGWDPVEILDAGPKARPEVGEVSEYVKDANGVVSTEPVLLVTPDGTRAYTPSYLEFHMYQKANFSALGV